MVKYMSKSCQNVPKCSRDGTLEIHRKTFSKTVKSDQRLWHLTWQTQSKWIRLDQSGSDWIKVDQTGSKQIRLDQSRPDWIKVDQTGSNRSDWVKAGKTRSDWIRLDHLTAIRQGRAVKPIRADETDQTRSTCQISWTLADLSALNQRGYRNTQDFHYHWTISSDHLSFVMCAMAHLAGIDKGPILDWWQWPDGMFQEMEEGGNSILRSTQWCQWCCKMQLHHLLVRWTRNGVGGQMGDWREDHRCQLQPD